MNFRTIKAPSTTITRDIVELEKDTGNIYESMVIIHKRANQIGKEITEELVQKLQDFASYSDNLEEIFENREQIEISKYYESLPKPNLIALQEFIDDKIYHRNPNKK
ncbi:MAG: RNA polymerase Rpb6 [Bacteroidetes bacterium 4572_128]|nr:MAG: RNA polymerase Rpb6 [Bacteroidetes bacterium 4572_128]